MTLSLNGAIRPPSAAALPFRSEWSGSSRPGSSDSGHLPVSSRDREDRRIVKVPKPGHVPPHPGHTGRAGGGHTGQFGRTGNTGRSRAHPADGLPGYRLGPELASGRLGPVVAGTRLVDEFAVAVHLVGQLDPATAGRVLDQAEDLRSAPHHPRLWPLLAAGLADDGSCFLVSGRADGSLADRLRADGPLAAHDILRVVAVICPALDALHQADILHGNITPANLLAAPAGEIVLAHPLLPALAPDGPGPNPGYRPPDVIGGEDWTVASDVYALAATVFTLLCGRMPYAATGGLEVGDDDVALRALTGPVPDLAGCGVPTAVVDVVRQAMSPQARQRPASAGEFGSLLARSFEQLETRPPTAPLPVAPAPGASARPTRDGGNNGEGGRELGSRYLLDTPIGRGATGQVWRARRRDTGSAVAVKVLRSDLAEQPETVTRFVRERHAMPKVRHPNVVRVLDLVIEGETLAIVMELVDGPDLRGMITAGRLPRDEARRLLAQVAEGLAAVHEAGIVHRDVKPENVLIDRSGATAVARLTDFGLARVAGDSSLTRSSRLMGTMAYLAPELAAARPPTPAVDVYSFGVLAYELFAGRRPFDADNEAALMLAHLQQRPERPADLPGPLWRAVERCLRKDPEERPSAAELARLLTSIDSRGDNAGPERSAPAADRRTAESLLTADATVAVPPRPPAKDVPSSRQGWWRLAAAVLVTLLAGAGVGVGLALRERPPAAPPPTTAAEWSLVPVAITVEAAGPDAARVSLSAGTDLPGAVEYRVYLNQESDIALPAGQRSRLFPGLAEGRHCFRAAAVVRTAQVSPSPAVPAPECLDIAAR
ncbi:serine/threonine protein kinase [Parafrankia sp. EUN1f]|nr:serine/threonine protein kinase [Parafrankia sp. EUN1f]